VLAEAEAHADVTLAPAAVAKEPAEAVAPPSVYRHFATAKPDFFIAGTVSVGFSLRSIVAIGYGRPHWLFVGVQAESVVATTFAAEEAGLKLVAPIGELLAQGRRTASYTHRFLADAPALDHDALVSSPGPAATYDALELSLTLYVPTGPGLTYGAFWVDRLFRVPDGALVYDEVTRAAVKGPWVGSEQLAYLLAVDRAGRHAVGPIVEHVWSNRERGSVVRLGLGYVAQFTAHTSFFAYATEPIVSPDSFGLWSAAGGMLELRYLWSSTDPRRTFP